MPRSREVASADPLWPAVGKMHPRHTCGGSHGGSQADGPGQRDDQAVVSTQAGSTSHRDPERSVGGSTPSPATKIWTWKPVEGPGSCFSVGLAKAARPFPAGRIRVCREDCRRAPECLIACERPGASLSGGSSRVAKEVGTCRRAGRSRSSLSLRSQLPDAVLRVAPRPPMGQSGGRWQ